jgi:ferredoxin-NADP reductase
VHLLSPGASSILGFATTLHLALALLRNHRRQSPAPVSSPALISFSFAALPWIFPSPAGLAAGFALHAAWFLACERLLAPVAARQPARPAGLAATAAESMIRRPAPRAVRPPSSAAAPPASLPRGSARTAPAAAPRGFVPAPVVGVFEETSDIRTFRVLRPEGFDFEAGQFLAVRIRVDGQEYVRCYSISSAPATSGYLEISVKRLGVVSNALHATARPGTLLSLKAPGGAFRYPSADDRPIVLLAGGIGITPLISMLRHAVATEPTRPVTVIYAAQHDRGFAFHDELKGLPRRHPQVRVYFVADQTSDPAVYRGRIDEALLRTVVPDLVHSIAFICGPKPMLEGLKTLLARLGVPQPQIRYEVFEAAVAVAAGLPEAGDPPADAGARPGAADADTHEMLCTKSATAVEVQPGETLLEAAEGAGIEIASLCRSGVCGTCRVRVASGHVRCDSTTLGEDERREGFVLACVTTVHGDCTVDV